MKAFKIRSTIQTPVSTHVIAFVLFFSLFSGTQEGKAQRMEIVLLHYYPVGGVSDLGVFLPGLGAGIRVGYGINKPNFFINGRVGCLYHWQFAIDGAYEEMYTAALSAQWGMHIYKSKAANRPLIYWLLHPQIGVAAYNYSFGKYENYHISPSWIDRLSYDLNFMTGFGTGPGFETGLNHKFRGFIEVEMGPMFYLPYYYSIKPVYTSLSAGVRF